MGRFPKHFAVRVGPLFALAAWLFTCVATISSAERIERAINVGGTRLDCIINLPDAIGSIATGPVLVAFHPGLASASDFKRISQLHAAVGAERSVVVCPEGFRRSRSVDEGSGSAQERSVDDLGYFPVMVSDLDGAAPALRRAYVTSFSRRAKMTFCVTCNLPGTAAAAAQVGRCTTLDDCHANVAVALPYIQGALDEFAPLRGGIGARSRAGIQPSIIENVSCFADRNSCSQTFSNTHVAEVSCCTLTSRANGATVVSCVFSDLDHPWPGGTRGILGSAMGLGPVRQAIRTS